MKWDSCENCKYSTDKYGPDLRCRRYPPEGGYSIFPIVKNSDWCGEFKSKYGSD